MFESTEKKNYIPPIAEAITILVKNGILQGSGTPGGTGVNGSTSTTAYDELDWN